MNNQIIGVFDSGVGGLSVLMRLQANLPNESFTYLADSAYAPYGVLDKETLHQRCHRIANFFMHQSAKALIIACNTASVAMAETLRSQYSIPIIAMEPAIKPACEQSKNAHIGIFATQNTLNSPRYQHLIKTFATSVHIEQSPCLGFVEQVEKGDIDSELTLSLIEENLSPMLEKGIDTLVLGCTHYPFLRTSIAQLATQLGHENLLILDTANAIAKQLQWVLDKHQLLATDNNTPIQHYYTTASPVLFTPIFSKLLHQAISLVQCRL